MQFKKSWLELRTLFTGIMLAAGLASSPNSAAAVVVARPDPDSMDRVVQDPANQRAITACLSVHPGSGSRTGMGTPFLESVQVLYARRGVDPDLLQLVTADTDGRRRVCTVERDNPQKISIRVILDNVLSVFVSAQTWPRNAVTQPPRGPCMHVITVAQRKNSSRQVMGWLLEKDARFRCQQADWLAPLRTPDF